MPYIDWTEILAQCGLESPGYAEASAAARQAKQDRLAREQAEREEKATQRKSSRKGR